MPTDYAGLTDRDVGELIAAEFDVSKAFGFLCVTSLDAAVSVVPDELIWGISKREDVDGTYCCEVWKRGEPGLLSQYLANATSPARALCEALLLAGEGE